LDRDRRAISFVKGCYLGQETVARIDALGHVNKMLRGLLLEGSDVPSSGTAIESGGKAVGTLTSAAFSPGRGGVVALGYVRSAQASAGTLVTVEGTRAVVCELPMPPAESTGP
jgi:folate-binding Fe-S cluster repair protein YgfZ